MEKPNNDESPSDRELGKQVKNPTRVDNCKVQKRVGR